LEYFLDITGFSKEEFYAEMKKKKMPQLDGVDLPIDHSEPPSQPVKPYLVDFINEIQKEYKNRDTRRSKKA